MKYALDTNVVFRYLKNESNTVQNVDRALAENHEICIPQIVNYEVMRGFKLMHKPSHRKEMVYELLTERCPMVEIETSIWEQAEDVYKELYRKGFTVGELDILIATFCLYHDLALVTNNTKDFKNISRLSIVDWTH